MGYSTEPKGWRIWSPLKKNTFVCRDVISHENDFDSPKDLDAQQLSWEEQVQPLDEAPSADFSEEQTTEQSESEGVYIKVKKSDITTVPEIPEVSEDHIQESIFEDSLEETTPDEHPVENLPDSEPTVEIIELGSEAEDLQPMGEEQELTATQLRRSSRERRPPQTLTYSAPGICITEHYT